MKVVKKITAFAAIAAMVVTAVPVSGSLSEIKAAAFEALALYDFEAGTGMTHSGIDGTAPVLVNDPERGIVLQFADGSNSQIVTAEQDPSLEEHSYSIKEGSPSSLKFTNPFKGKNLSGATIAMWVKIPTDKAAGITSDGEVDETLSVASGLVGFVDSQERGLVHPDAEDGGMSDQIYSGRTFFGINAQPGVYFKQIHDNYIASVDTEATLADFVGEWEYFAVSITNDGVICYVNGRRVNSSEITMGQRFKGSEEHANAGNDGMPYLLDFLSDNMSYTFGGIKGTHTFVDAKSKRQVTYGKIESNVSGYVGFTGFSGTQAGVCIDDLAFFSKAYSASEMAALYEAAKNSDIGTGGPGVSEEVENPYKVIENDETGIPDENLYKFALKQCDSNQDGVLTVGEAKAAQVLFFTSLPLKNLQGIQYFTGMTTLGLYDCQISDISLLTELHNLRELGLYDNKISDVSPLSGLTNLTILYLGNNNITDVSPLSGLTNLKELTLNDNKITDISGLSGLTNLVTLRLDGNNITDISLLSGLTNLEELWLSDNNIADVSPLAGLTKLWYLDLGDNRITDISALAGLSNLEYLCLNNNKIKDISPLSGLTNLRHLCLDNNEIEDISALSGLLNLEELSLGSTTREYNPNELPASLDESKFILKIDYNYTGSLPEQANIYIPVGEEYAGKKVSFALLKEDKTYEVLEKVTVDWDGYITVPQVNSGSAYIVIVENLLGDTDGDGKITTSDALAILKYVAKIEQDGFINDAADCDKDGKITTSDALAVLKHVAQIEFIK